MSSRGSRGGGPEEGGEKKKPAYRAPRIGESYQCPVPGFESRLNPKDKRRNRRNPQAAASALAEELANDLRSSQYGLKDGLIWSPSAVPKASEVDDFLLFTRTVLEQPTHDVEGRQEAEDGPWRMPNGELVPLEADEGALTYLFQQKYSLPMAKLRVISDLGMKREHKFLHALETMYQQGATATTLERRDRSSLLGSYTSVTPGQREAYLLKNPYQYRFPRFPKPAPAPEDPSATGGGGAAVAPTGSSASSAAGDGGGEGMVPVTPAALAVAPTTNGSGGESSSASSSPGSGPTGMDVDDQAGALDSRKKRVTADKAEMRKMWQSLQERAAALVKAVEMTRKSVKTADRPKLLSVLSLIKEAQDLPKLDLPPGDSPYRELEDSIQALKESVASCRPNVALVHDALNCTSAHPPASFEELKELLRILRGQTVELPEEALLIRVIKSAEQWQSAADAMLNDLKKTNHLKARELIKQSESIPCHFRQKDLLLRKLSEIDMLASEVTEIKAPPASLVLASGRQAARQAASEPKPYTLLTLRQLQSRVETIGLKFPEGQTVTEMLERSERWMSEAETALSASPDLKKLQALLEEAAELPVDVLSTCDQIQQKVEQANKWVEKVRKALPRKKTRGNTGEIIKVDYTAARTLLDEGKDMSVEVKELDDIAGVLDTAETWLQRVREALEESHDEASLEALQSLLTEADTIPVVMEEHRVLASEIEIRKWGLRVQPRFEVEKITVAELEAIICEAQELRTRLPLSPKEQKTWRIPQEAQAKSLLEQSTQWMARYKRCLHPNGSGLRRNVGLEKLLPLIDDGKKVPVELSEYILPLTEAVASAERWYQDSTPLLKACRVHMTSLRTPSPVLSAHEELEGEEGEATPMDQDGAPSGSDHQQQQDGEAASEAASKQQHAPPKKVTIQEVVDCVAAAESATLSIDLPEVEQLRTLITKVNQWIEKLQSTCPTRLSKRRGRAKATVEEIRRVVEQGAKFPIDVTEEVNKIRDRLQDAKDWQKRVDSELLTLGRSAIDEVQRFSSFFKKKCEDREARRGQPPREGEEESTEEEMEPDEARLTRLEEMVDEAGDVPVETKEEEMVGRHLRAHKWFAQCMELLQFVDPKGLIGDSTIRDIDKLVEEGKELLGLTWDEDDNNDDMQQDAAPDKALAAVKGEAGEEGSFVSGQEYEQAMKPSLLGPRIQRRKTAEEVVREMRKNKERRRRSFEEKEAAQSENGMADSSKGEKSEDDDDEEDDEDEDGGSGMDLDDSHKKKGEEEGGLLMLLPEDDDEESAAEKRECDRVLEEGTQLWWDKIGGLREICDKSMNWLERANRALGIGSEKVAIETLEGLMTEAKGWEFEVEYGRKLEAELQRAQNIQARAIAALYKKPLPVGQLKTLIGEGDKCRVQLEEIRSLKKHLVQAQRWLQRWQRVRDEELEEMLLLAREADEIQADLSQELKTLRRVTDRCCLCRSVKEPGMIQCAECGEQYHHRCLDITEMSAETWRKRGWRCARCLVRWHLKDSLEKATATLYRYLSSPPASAPSGDSLMAHESLAFALHDQQQPTTTTTTPQPDAQLRAGLSPAAGGLGPSSPFAAQTTNRNLRVTMWMKRLLHAFRTCAEHGQRELMILGHPRKVKSSILVEVIRLAKMDPEVDSSLDVREVIWNLSVVFWGARLICQLRKRPNLLDLQALTKEMPSVGIINEPLHHMLNGLIGRAQAWIYRTRPLLREAWMHQDRMLDVERLRMLLREKRNIPVRLVLERRLEALLGEELPGKRYCRCRGFYDGLFMVQCVACQEWFHGKCVQVRAEDVERIEFLCETCCMAARKPYPFPPYLPPNPDAALAERDEDDDHIIDEEELLADRKCLEGVWPNTDRLVALDRTSAHIDPYAMAGERHKKSTPAVPTPPHERRLSSGGGAGTGSSVLGGSPGGAGSSLALGMAGTSTPPPPEPLGPPIKKPTTSSSSGGGKAAFSSSKSEAPVPVRTSSRPPKPQQQPCYDYDLDLPPAQRIPTRPKAIKPPASAQQQSVTADDGSAGGDSETPPDDNSLSDGGGAAGGGGLLGKRSRKPPKNNDDFVFEGRSATAKSQRLGGGSSSSLLAPSPTPGGQQKENQPKRGSSNGRSRSRELSLDDMEDDMGDDAMLEY